MGILKKLPDNEIHPIRIKSRTLKKSHKRSGVKNSKDQIKIMGNNFRVQLICEQYVRSNISKKQRNY